MFVVSFRPPRPDPVSVRAPSRISCPDSITRSRRKESRPSRFRYIIMGEAAMKCPRHSSRFAAAIVPLFVVLALGAPWASAQGASDAFVQAKRLGRGVNILGYDAIWKNPKKARFEEKHFKLIREAGFRSVRINLHALQLLGRP